MVTEKLQNCLTNKTKYAKILFTNGFKLLEKLYLGEYIVSSGLQKIIFLIIVICLLLSMTPSTIATAGTFVATDSVRVRAGPSIDANVITVVHAGANVEVLDHNPSGWSKVQVGGSTGFIRSDFLKFPVNGTATFSTTAGVNVRSDASTTSNTLQSVAAGTSIEVSEHDPSGWSRVSVGGVSGFIRSDFITRGGDGSSALATTSTEATAATTSTATSTGTLRTTGTVNLREGASTDDRIIRTLAASTSVEVLENQSNGWSRVRHSGTEGFIRSDLLSESGATGTVAALRTTGTVNLRSGPSTNSSVIRSLSPGTGVEVLEKQSNGWSSVRHNGTNGFILSDLLTDSTSGGTGTTLRTVTGVNFRTGPSTNHSVIMLLPVNTSIEVLEQQSNGWSRVRYSGNEGYIRSDLLGSGARTVELIDWSTANSIVPTGVNLNVVDVRTGITFQLRGFAKSGHMDVEPPTQADTDAIFRTRNGVWAWAPRPVWVTVGDRTFAAAINGMPHDVSTISNNGMNGHLCMHFNNTVTNSQSYQRDLRSAVTEAYNARPR